MDSEPLKQLIELGAGVQAQKGEVHVLLPNGSNLTEDIARCLCRIENLVDLSACKCMGTTSSWSLLAGLSSLRSFSATGANLGDAEANAIASLSSLSRVCVNETHLSDEGISLLAKLPNLEDLSIGSPTGGPYLTDKSLQSLVSARTLRDLEICADIDDDSTHLFNEFGQLVGLSAEGLLVTDSGMRFLRALPNLETLSINDNNLTEATLRYLKNHPNLKLLYIDFPLTRQGCECLSTIPKLEDVYLTGDAHDESDTNIGSLLPDRIAVW